MVLNDPLAAMFSKMQNAIQVGKREIVVKPISKFMIEVLEILKQYDYVKEFEVIEDGRGNHMIIRGFENINKCGVIKPRFNYKLANAVVEESKYLPAKGFGIIIVSTSKGLITLEKATELQVGGKLVAYCY